jgi:membrane-associated phospholipid phosphatase
LKLQFEKLWAGRRREDWLLLGLVAGSFVLAFVFGKLVSEVLEGELSGIDRALRHWALAHRSPTAGAIFSTITMLGAKEVLAPLSALIAWRFFRGAKRLMAVLVFCALASAEFVALLKRDFHIGRPAGGLAEGLGYSFPSGHSTGSMAVAIVLSYVAIQRRIAPRVIVPASAAFVLLVGFSRMYLDLHWASDVIGGWLVGAAFGIGCCALYEWTEGKSKDMRGDPSPESASGPVGQ